MNLITRCCGIDGMPESPKIEVIDSNGKPIVNRPLERVKKTDSLAIRTFKPEEKK